MDELKFYNKNTIKDVIFPDTYFLPIYGEACEFSDNAEWECCLYKDLIYVYLKRPILYNDIFYYDLITPYGYSGYYFNNNNTYDKFIPLFRKIAINRNYVTEVVRQNPYININLLNYDKINFKTIYGIRINNFEDYWNNVLNTKKRNMYTKSIKNNLNFKLIKLSYANLKDKFLDLYNFTMDKVSAKSYYYFNENYFKTLEKIENSYLAEITNSNNKVIGCSIIFIFGNYIHYHLSCNDNSMNCITDFLLINIVKELGKDKLIILGGGLSDNDDLSKFKRSLSNETFTYNIYKNIINKNIYDELSIGKETNNFFPAYR
jgi:hypothetical protein